jgi:hypothetical protein
MFRKKASGHPILYVIKKSITKLPLSLGYDVVILKKQQHNIQHHGASR